MTVRQPDVGAVDARDVRTSGGKRTQSDPSGARRRIRERREQLGGVVMNLFADFEVDAAIEANIFFVGPGDQESIRALKHVAVAAAQHRAQRAGRELESDQMALDWLHGR